MGWLPLLFNVALEYDKRYLPVHVNLQSSINQPNSLLHRLYKHYGTIHAQNGQLKRHTMTIGLTINTTRTKDKIQSRRGLSHQQAQIPQTRHTFPYYLSQNHTKCIQRLGHEMAQLVQALLYKPEGFGLDPQWCHCNFSLT